MNRIIINIHQLNPASTTGRILVQPEGQGLIYICDSLEDLTIDNLTAETKVFGQTAIPYGIFQAQNMWWPKHQLFTPMLFDVPFFEGIRIHIANMASQIEGCIATGFLANQEFNADSHKAFDALMEIVGKWNGVYEVEKKKADDLIDLRIK
jgi:Family of unknown function (DUF5675)